jgi:hypothetical protein
MSSLSVIREPIGPDRLVKLTIENLAENNNETILHLDPALSRDNYGLAFGHIETIEGRPCVVISGIMAWEPTDESNVSIVNVQQAVYAIANRRRLRKITSDHKESAETLQRFRMAGFNVDTIHFSNSTQLAMYSAYRTLLDEGRVLLPKNSPWTPLLKEEHLNVELIRNIKVDHRPGKSKDILDCVAAVTWQLIGSHLLVNEDSLPIAFKTSTTRKNGMLVPYAKDISKESYIADIRSRRTKWRAAGSDYLYLSTNTTQENYFSDEIIQLSSTINQHPYEP